MKPLPEKLYFRTNELAKAFNVNTSLIRFWEKEFDFLLKPKKNAKGERLYTSKDVENLKIIFHLVKDNGYTLDGAKKKLRSDRQKIKRNLSLIDRLERVKSELKKIRENL